MKTKKIMYIVLSILIPLIIGFIGSMLGGSMALFDNIKKPIFAPPAIIFPIVWGILYIFIGISSYLVYISDSRYKKTGLIFYAIQLVVNALWTMIFFRFENFLFANSLSHFANICFNIKLFYVYIKLNKRRLLPSLNIWIYHFIQYFRV